MGYTHVEGPTSCIGYVFPNLDGDGDGLIDGAELLAGTDPFNRHSDDDALRDGKEVNYAELPGDPLVPLACDPLRLDAFDGGPVDRWNQLIEAGSGELSLQPATLGGGIWVGENLVATLAAAGDLAYLLDTTPERESSYRARFWIDTSDLTMANGESVAVLLTRDQVAAVNPFYLQVRRLSGELFVRGVARDATGTLFTENVPLGDGPALIAVEWWSEGARSAPYGGLRIRTSARPAAPILRLANSAFRVDNAAFGVRFGVASGTSGDVRFEDFKSCRN